MKKPLPVFLLLIGIILIPTIGVFSSNLMQNKFDSIVREGTRDDFKKIMIEEGRDLSQLETVVSELTFDEFCTGDFSGLFGPSLSGSCADYENIKLIATVSHVSAGVGVLLIFLIFIAGLISRLNRYLLLLLFLPGVYVTLIVTAILVITNAGIILATLYYLPVVYFERFFPKILILIGVGALYGIFLIIRAMFLMVRRARMVAIGKIVTKEDQPKLWQYVHRLAEKIGAKSPQNIILGLEPNFYVTEAYVNCLGDRLLKGRTMYLALPLARILSEPELRSVIGHELGHYIGFDTKFSSLFYPIYRGTTEAISGMYSIMDDDTDSATISSLALLPAMSTLTLFLYAFSTAESKISRVRELKADNIGAKAATARDLASALVKLHAFSEYWSVIREKNAEILKEKGEHISNQSTFFQAIIKAVAKPAVIKGLNNSRTTHPTDSHPPLIFRLESLNLKIEDVHNLALQLSPDNNCINLIDRIEEIEIELSLLESLVLARQLGINI